MDLNENIKNNIQNLRRERSITQDVLAAALDISVQAISKWETGISLPDIMQLPRIAQFFGVTIDYLFYNESTTQSLLTVDLPNDDIYRVIQFKGNKMLDVDTWEEDKYILLKLPEAINNQISENVNIEIWGNANINGNVSGNVECKGTLNCGNIEGYAVGDKGINCGNIGAYAKCESDINCGNINSYVESGGSVNCGSISGNVECKGDVSCSQIMSSVDCNGNVHCKEITGEVQCNGNIIYEK